jgi:hypothetical protein
MKMMDDGKSLKETRAQIETTYSNMDRLCHTGSSMTKKPHD